jgi:hypothetical protein
MSHINGNNSSKKSQSFWNNIDKKNAGISSTKMFGFFGRRKKGSSPTGNEVAKQREQGPFIMAHFNP